MNIDFHCDVGRRISREIKVDPIADQACALNVETRVVCVETVQILFKTLLLRNRPQRRALLAVRRRFSKKTNRAIRLRLWDCNVFAGISYRYGGSGSFERVSV